jgi:hypothetical protein
MPKNVSQNAVFLKNDKFLFFDRDFYNEIKAGIKKAKTCVNFDDVSIKLDEVLQRLENKFEVKPEVYKKLAGMDQKLVTQLTKEASTRKKKIEFLQPGTTEAEDMDN